MPDNFNISKDGIQIPYRRFMSDSAAGFALLLLLTVYYYFPLFTKESLRTIAACASLGPGPIGGEAKVFVLVLAFLLATPLGFAVNGMSWLCLGRLLSIVTGVCFKWNGGPFYSTWNLAESRRTVSIAKQFGIGDAETFTQNVSLLRQTLKFPPFSGFAWETQVGGLTEFLRNIALFLLIGSGIAVYSSSLLIDQTPRFWIAVACMFFALTLRVPRRTTQQNFARYVMIVLVTILAILPLYLGASCLLKADNSSLMNRAVVSLVAFIMVSLLAGLIGFYDCCGAIMQAYFAAIAVCGGVPKTISESDEINPDEVVRLMVDRASALARATTQKRE